MKRQSVLGAGLVSLVMLCCVGSAHAQLYKWIGVDGKVTYSDVPPPVTAKQVERKAISNTGDTDTSDLPFDLASAVKASPVTLYTSPKCSPCQQARALLVTRGVPFTEKTVSSNDDIEKLRQVSGDAQLPFLQVGSGKQQGFASDAWTGMLTAAGYPETSMLPKTWRQPPATAAAPPKPAPAGTAADKQAQRGSDVAPAPAGNAPPGFRF
ncbi:MAG: DUF4124 domain-containing protein [Janthinobacterium lividum]